MAEPKNPREPRIPKETAPFDADNKWTRTWIMYFESLFTLSVKEAVRQTLEVAVTHTDDLTKDLPVFGNDKADVKVGTKTGNTNKLVTNTGTNVTGNTVKWDASGNLIDAGTTPGGGGGGSGTVTSVALTVPAEFSVSGSPVTTSGTLAVSKATQSANTVYAGPTTGSAAAPTFRSVVPADLPFASSSAFGAVKVDGTTITAASGVISASGGAAGAMVLLEQHTASSSASLDFTTCITSTYDEYRIELVGIRVGTNGAQLLIRFSTDGGSTYVATGSYDWGQNVCVVGVNATGVNGNANDTGIPIFGDGAGGGILGAAIPGVVASLVLYDPLNTSNHKVVSGHGSAVYYSNSNRYHFAMSGVFKSTTAVNAIRFIFSSGNIASGTVRVYGIAK